jgi:hypothetical protein
MGLPRLRSASPEGIMALRTLSIRAPHPQGSRGIAMMTAALVDPRGIRSILVAVGLRMGRECHTGAAFGES